MQFNIYIVDIFQGTDNLELPNYTFCCGRFPNNFTRFYVALFQTIPKRLLKVPDQSIPLT